MNLAFVIKREKSDDPIAHAMRTASREMGFDIRYVDEDLREYKYVIVFNLKRSLKVDKNAIVAWWMGDLRLPKELREGELGLKEKFISKNIDLIFLCHNEYKDIYKKTYGLPVYYMPQCGLEYSEFKKRDVRWDVLFIGSKGNANHPYHSNRKPIFDVLSNYNIKIINKEITTHDQKYLYHHTPINLSISCAMKGGTSNRLYNILASEGFALVKYFPEMEYLFTNGKHLVWFEGVKEVKGLVDYYLSCKKERSRIARNGYELFLEKHRAKHRIQNMMDIMQNKTEEFYGYL